MVQRWFESKWVWFYAISRVLIGLLFLQHGLMKLFGLWTKSGAGMEAFSLMWWVGIAELMIGLGIATGVLTRIAALGGIIVMLSAQIKAHWPQGFWPAANGGELSLVFLACFIAILALGAQRLSLERLVLKRELV